MIEALLQAERLLIHGMIEQAERIYTSAIEQDPRNAIAVVGLARIALERGDERLAYDRACSALEIDPHNAAALRLEARLSEVFAARGEEVARPSFLGADSAPAVAPTASPDAALPPEHSESPPDAGPDALPSEQTFFTRNPTMAEHQRMEQQRARSRAEQSLPESPTSQEPGEKRTGERPGFFRRLWSDDR